MKSNHLNPVVSQSQDNDLCQEPADAESLNARVASNNKGSISNNGELFKEPDTGDSGDSKPAGGEPINPLPFSDAEGLNASAASNNKGSISNNGEPFKEPDTGDSGDSKPAGQEPSMLGK